MTRWQDAFEKSSFINQWSELLALAEDHDFPLPEDTQTIVEYTRLGKMVSHITSLIQSIDKDLFPEHQLQPLGDRTGNVLAELTSFRNNSNRQHLRNCNSQLDMVLTLLAQAVPLFGMEETAVSHYSDNLLNQLEAVNLRNEEIRVSVEKSTTMLAAQTLAIKQKAADLEQHIQQIDSTTQGLLAEFNTQFKAEENERKGDFKSIVESLQEETRRLLEEVKGFTQGASDRTLSETTKLTNQVEAKSDETVKNLQESADREFEKLSIKSGKIIEVLAKFQDDASRVYDVTINTLHGGAYSSYANEERKTANKYRFFASSLMLIGVALLVAPEALIFLPNSTHTFEWSKVLARAPLSLVVFVPAFYFARESGKHRNTEIVNRRRQHILTTLDPYIELMDDDKGQHLKEHVGKTVFSEAQVQDNTNPEAGNILAQLSTLAKTLRK